MSLNRRLKYHRTKAGMTQESVANALGIRATNYAKYESGERSPKDDRLVELAKILNTSYNALLIGEVSIAIDLLNRHLRSAVLGDIDGFCAFVSDFENLGNVYYTIMDLLVSWDKSIQEKYSNFHSEFLESPSLTSLIELDKHFKCSRGHLNAHHVEMNVNTSDTLDGNHSFDDNELDDATIYKMAFCIAAEGYIDMRTHGCFCVDSILSDVRKHLQNENTSDMEVLQQFAVLVLTPFLSHLLDTLEFIAVNNSNMNDFALFFLHNTLTPYEDDNEWSDLG